MHLLSSARWVGSLRGHHGGRGHWSLIDIGLCRKAYQIENDFIFFCSTRIIRSANLQYLMYMYLYKFLYVYVCCSTVLVDAVVHSLPIVMEVEVNLCLALFISFLLNENYKQYNGNSY